MVQHALRTLHHTRPRTTLVHVFTIDVHWTHVTGTNGCAILREDAHSMTDMVQVGKTKRRMQSGLLSAMPVLPKWSRLCFAPSGAIVDSAAKLILRLSLLSSFVTVSWGRKPVQPSQSEECPLMRV